MKLIHCADLHLDSPMTSKKTKEQAKKRRTELLFNFQRMVEYGVKNKVDAILIAGDLFDSSVVRKSISETVLEQIKSAPQIKFFYLRGNHDQQFEWNRRTNELPENLIMFQDGIEYYYGENVCIAGMILNGDNVNNVAQMLDFEPERFNILMLHGQVRNYRCEEETYQITMTDYKYKNIDYAALGHIHEYREGKIDERGIYVYSGCLEARGYDECGPKGFILLEVGQGTFTHEFIPFAQRTVHEVTLNVSDYDTTKQVINALQNEMADMSGSDMVKATLTGIWKSERLLETEYIHTCFKDCFEDFKILDKTRLYLNPDDYIYDASLRGSFLRLCMQSQMDEEERKRIIEIGLRALGGEDL